MKRNAAICAFLVPALLLAACGSKHSPGPPKAKTPKSKTIYAGELGVPPTPGPAHPGPNLVLPGNALKVPGTFPLNSLVKFNVAIRNDGTRPLVIKKIDPG